MSPSIVSSCARRCWRPRRSADAARRLMRDPLGARALALASASLTARMSAPGTKPAAAQSIDRYARRAAFRATPAGLLAGVTVGTLGPRTGGATGTPRAHLAASWARMARLGRALLEDPEVRNQVHLRCAPSLLRGKDRVRWLAGSAGMAEEREADVDARLVCASSTRATTGHRGSRRARRSRRPRAVGRGKATPDRTPRRPPPRRGRRRRRRRAPAAAPRRRASVLRSHAAARRAARRPLDVRPAGGPAAAAAGDRHPRARVRRARRRRSRRRPSRASRAAGCSEPRRRQ